MVKSSRSLGHVKISYYLCMRYEIRRMLLNQFDKRFPDEDSCIDYFRRIREPALPHCPKCGCANYNWAAGKQDFECKECRHRIPLTKGTVMEYSKRPLQFWFYTMHLMTSIKQVLSAKEVQHQLGMNQYPPVWPSIKRWTKGSCNCT